MWETPEGAGNTDTGGQSAPEISPAIQSRLDELSSQLQSLQAPPQPQYTQGLTDTVMQPPQQPQEPEQFQQPGDEYGQYGYDPQVEQQQAMAELQTFIQSQIQEGIQQTVTPWMRQQQAEALEAKYPDLQKPEVAGPLVEDAQRFAQMLGTPQLAGDPRFIERMYLAQLASTQATQQTAVDGSNGVHLEGSGATPQAQEADLGDAMLAAHGVDPGSAFS